MEALCLVIDTYKLNMQLLNIHLQIDWFTQQMLKCTYANGTRNIWILFVGVLAGYDSIYSIPRDAYLLIYFSEVFADAYQPMLLVLIYR